MLLDFPQSTPNLRSLALHYAGNTPRWEPSIDPFGLLPNAEISHVVQHPPLSFLPQTHSPLRSRPSTIITSISPWIPFWTLRRGIAFLKVCSCRLTTRNGPGFAVSSCGSEPTSPPINIFLGRDGWPNPGLQHTSPKRHRSGHYFRNGD